MIVQKQCNYTEKVDKKLLKDNMDVEMLIRHMTRKGSRLYFKQNFIFLRVHPKLK